MSRLSESGRNVYSAASSAAVNAARQVFALVGQQSRVDRRQE
jgi:hypothetical protein